MWSSVRVDPDTYIPCYTGNMNYTRQFYNAYLWSWNILIDSPVGILCYRDYKYYMTFITTIRIYLMLLHHFYDTGFYCIYCILYIIQVFIVYIVLHTVNRSGIDLNKDDYYYYIILLIIYQWFSACLWYLQCVGNGDTKALHIKLIYSLKLRYAIEWS